MSDKSGGPIARAAPQDFRDRPAASAERAGAGAVDPAAPDGSAIQTTPATPASTLPATPTPASGIAAGAPAAQAATAPSTSAGPAAAAPTPPQSPGASTAAQVIPAAQNAAAEKPPASPTDDPDKDELREVILRLGRAAPKIMNTDPALTRTIEVLMREMDSPGRREDPVFRTRVAYAVEDAEKQSDFIQMPPNLRAELGKLSGTYPGLQNDRMRALLESTPTIDDKGVVRNIRAAAMQIANGPDQATATVASRIDALENQVRLSPKVVALDPLPFTTSTATQRAAGDPAQTQSQMGNRRQPSQDVAQEGQAAAQHRPGRIMLDIMTRLRKPEPEDPAPWDRQLTPMGDRITAYNAKMREGDEEQGFRRAEKSGQAALTAMKDFSDGPGTVLMARIREAAKTDPQGMAGVLSEMREGGRYAGLRQDFNVALQQEKSFAASYERAAGAVAKFGGDRVEVDKIAEMRPDTAAIAGRFQKLDAEIGKAASELPGKTEGKSFTDELAERASDVVRKAVDVVANAFNRLRATSSPSPSL